MTGQVEFEAKFVVGPHGRMFLRPPFDPAQVWGERTLYRLTGAVNGEKIRALMERHDGEWRLMLTPMWIDCLGLRDDDTVRVVMALEGPQRDGLDADIAAALDAEPQAAAYYDALAQFYRRAYLKWIDGTKRRPELRAERIAEMVRLLKAGTKARP